MLTRSRPEAQREPSGDTGTRQDIPDRPAAPLDPAQAPDETSGALPRAASSSGGPTLRVIVRRGDHERTSIFALTRPVATIGSDDTCTIRIDAPGIPPALAEIVRPEQGAPVLRVHDTATPLAADGRPFRERALQPGDVVTVGDLEHPSATLIYEESSQMGTEASRSSGQHVRLPLARETTLGRAHDNQIVLDHPRVSQHHARLTRDDRGNVLLTDLGSTNGTYVNGLRISRVRLMPGAEVRIGPYRLIFTGDELTQYDDSSSIRIDAGNLTERTGGGLFGRRRRVILDNVSLSILPGTFVALVGSSGAGKSTLMNALNGQRPAQSGVVLYNGVNLYEHMDEFSGAMGYVPQDDIIHKNLTVERAMYYAARLRLPSDYSRKQIKQRITEVLEDIEMTGTRHQLVSSLSGGQRKRVSIGVELLARPAVFFLDEPTSGLDPGLDRTMMQLLRRLADRGHTIVLSTHATSDMDCCDMVAFIAPGGRLAFYGPPADMRRYFETDDYAAIYNKVHDEPDFWVARYQQSEEYMRYVASPQLQSQSQAHLARGRANPRRPRVRRPGKLRQFLLLTRRYAEIMAHDQMNVLILLAQAPIIGLLTILLAEKNIVHYVSLPSELANPKDVFAQRTLFILAASAIWFGIINAAREIVKEAPIYQRERAIHLAILPYVLSKMVVLGVIAAIQSFLLLVIVGWKTGYADTGIAWHAPKSGFWEEYFVLFLMSLVGITMGLVISALAPNTDRAISIVPIVLLPQIIFANVIFTLEGSGNWISYIIPARWGMQALGSVTRLRDRFTDHPNLAFYQSDLKHLLGFCGALAGLGVVSFLLTMYFLWRRDVFHHHHSHGAEEK